MTGRKHYNSILTYCIEQSPSWEANRFVASQEVPRILLNPKVHYQFSSFTISRHLSLSWASPIQSKPPHPTSWRSILILFSHLRLDLPSYLFPSGFPTKTLYTPTTTLHTQLKNIYSKSKQGKLCGKLCTKNVQWCY
jgi:hypothetical protein